MFTNLQERCRYMPCTVACVSRLCALLGLRSKVCVAGVLKAKTMEERRRRVVERAGCRETAGCGLLTADCWTLFGRGRGLAHLGVGKQRGEAATAGTVKANSGERGNGGPLQRGNAATGEIWRWGAQQRGSVALGKRHGATRGRWCARPTVQEATQEPTQETVQEGHT